MQKQDAYVGQQVYFGRRNGEKTLGEVVKVNGKNLKVKQLETRGEYKSYPVGTLWTVPPTLCTPADDGQTRPSKVTTPPKAKRPCLVDVITGKRYYGRPGESSDSLFGRLANGLK